MSKQEMEELLNEYGVAYTSTLADKLLEVIAKERADAIEEFADKILECAIYTETEEGWSGMTVDVKVIQMFAEQLKEQKNDSN